MKHFFGKMMNSAPAPRPTRRTFLKMTAGAAAGGFLIGLNLPSAARADGTAAGAAKDMFTPFIKVMPDGQVIVLDKHLDMGQGNATGLATLVAEEMDASIEQVSAEFAPAAPAYFNLFFGVQGTGGSTAIANSFMQYREAGASARAMFVAAAAAAWKVPASEITIKNGVISHASGKSGGFSEFVEAAAKQPVPEKPAVKDPKDWVYIGKAFPRVDNKLKSTGAVDTYTMDFQPDGLVVAVIARPPKWGAVVKSFDASEAKKVNGVIDVIQIPRGIAVLAQSTWPAIKGRDALNITWDDSAAEKRSSDQLFTEYRNLADKPGMPADVLGDTDTAMASAAKTLEMTYEFPYLAHAAMEPMDVAIQFNGTHATIWAGSQFQTIDQQVAATVLGIPPENVTVNTLWAGGSFGRRATADSHVAAEAASIAKAWGKQLPIKVVWTREDDMTGGYYRPMYVHKVKLGLDGSGNQVAWQHRIVGQSILSGTPFESVMVKDGVDETSVEGTAHTDYDLKNLRVELHSPKVGVPPLWWRSVGNTHTAYVMETVLDVIAKESGRDPLDLRRELLKGSPRLLNVLNVVAEKADWGKKPAEGRYRGIAVHKSFNSYVAEVAEIALEDGEVKVKKVWCAVDCGIAVNPDVIAAQMQGGIGYGLGAVLRNEITLNDGVVDQTNFDTYTPLRMEDMPEVEVHVVASAEAPTGVGEPGTPPIGPAVANAVFAATGTMPTILPFSRTGLSS